MTREQRDTSRDLQENDKCNRLVTSCIVITVVDGQPGSVESAPIQLPLVTEFSWLIAAVGTARVKSQPVCWVDLQFAGQRSA